MPRKNLPTDVMGPSSEAIQQEKLLAAIILDSEKAIYTEDYAGIITSWNRGAEIMFGYSAREAVGQPASFFIPQNQLEDDVEVRGRVLSGTRVRHFESIRTARDGRAIAVAMSLAPLRDENRKIFGLYRIAVESVDWQKNLDKMQLLAAIVNYSQNSIISVDSNGYITSWNKGAEQIFGYTAQEMVGRHITYFVPSELRNQELDILKRIQEGQSVYRHETYRTCKDGSRAYGIVTISPIIDGHGRVVGASRVALDITERKKAEERLQMLVSALKAAANGIIITDLKGVIEWGNEAFTKLTGYSMEEVKGKTPAILKSGKQDSEFYAKMWQQILSGQNWQGELVNRRKDGTLYNEEMIITPIRDGGGELSYFIAVKQDITERIHASAEREKLITELKEALSNIQTLSGLLPICANCKKVRDDSGYWSQVEVYVQKHSHASFTHGICPDCAERMLKELDKVAPGPLIPVDS